jgi:hypothetical protein
LLMSNISKAPSEVPIKAAMPLLVTFILVGTSCKPTEKTYYPVVDSQIAMVPSSEMVIN